jgi:hypothetical protein
MKKLIVSFALMVITLASYAQVYKMYSTRNYHNQLRLNTMTGEVQQIQDDGQSWIICSAREISGDKESRFCLYETQNMWTFIMLDTYTGKNWQVQFSVKGEDYMFAVPNQHLLSCISRKQLQIGLIGFRCLPPKTCGLSYY